MKKHSILLIFCMSLLYFVCLIADGDYVDKKYLEEPILKYYTGNYFCKSINARKSYVNANEAMSVDQDHMSHVMRKPTFCICENKDADQLRGYRKADLRLCFSYIVQSLYFLNQKFQAPSHLL